MIWDLISRKPQLSIKTAFCSLSKLLRADIEICGIECCIIISSIIIFFVKLAFFDTVTYFNLALYFFLSILIIRTWHKYNTLFYWTQQAWFVRTKVRQGMNRTRTSEYSIFTYGAQYTGCTYLLEWDVNNLNINCIYSIATGAKQTLPPIGNIFFPSKCNLQCQ